MIFGEPLSNFLLRWLAIIAVITLIVLFPFLIRRIQPGWYRGFWKAFGESHRSPKRVLMLPLEMLIGLAFLLVAFFVWELVP